MWRSCSPDLPGGALRIRRRRVGCSAYRSAWHCWRTVRLRHLLLLALTLVVAACGGESERTNEPRTSGETTATTSTVPVEQSPLTPPRILLRSPVGSQEAVRGSFCVSRVRQGTGSTHCADS